MTFDNRLHAYFFIYIFLHRIEGRGHQGGRGPMFTRAQEAAIVNMVLTNNCIRLREIQANIINNDHVFNNIQRVSLSTLGRILKKNQIYMKRLYRVPFDRNSERVKHLRNENVEVCIVHLIMVWYCALLIMFWHKKILCNRY